MESIVKMGVKSPAKKSQAGSSGYRSDGPVQDAASGLRDAGRQDFYGAAQYSAGGSRTGAGEAAGTGRSYAGYSADAVYGQRSPAGQAAGGGTAGHSTAAYYGTAGSSAAGSGAAGRGKAGDGAAGTAGVGSGSVDPAEMQAFQEMQHHAVMEERALRKSRRNQYRLIAAYVVASVVICYALLRLTENVGAIVKTLGKVTQMVGMLLAPLFWGFVLAYILMPVAGFWEKKLKNVRLFKKKGSRRAPAVAITCALAALILLVLLSVVVSAVSKSLKVAGPDDLINMVQSFAGSLGNFQKMLQNKLGELNISSEEINSALKQLGEKVAQFTSGLSKDLTGAIGHIGGFLTSTLFAIIFAIYFLLDVRGLKRYWNRVLLAVGGRKVRHNFHLLAQDADAVFSGYIRGQLIDALIMAVLVSAALYVIGVPYAVIIGILSGIGNLIPYLGPVVAYGSTILVCLLSGDLRRLLVAIVVLFVIQTVDGNIINPKLLSSSIDVHPMLVIAALLVGGSFGGIVGMLFAVPVAAFLRIQFDKVIDRLIFVREPQKAVSRMKASASGGSTKAGDTRTGDSAKKVEASGKGAEITSVKPATAGKKAAASPVRTEASGRKASSPVKAEVPVKRAEGAPVKAETAGNKKAVSRGKTGTPVKKTRTSSAKAGISVEKAKPSRAKADASAKKAKAADPKEKNSAGVKEVSDHQP